MSDKLRFFIFLFFLVISSAVIRKSLLCICKHLCFEVFVTFSLSPFSFAHPFVLQKVSSDPLLSKHWLSHLSFPLCLFVPIWLGFFFLVFLVVAFFCSLSIRHKHAGAERSLCHSVSTTCLCCYQCLILHYFAKLFQCEFLICLKVESKAANWQKRA